MAKLTKSTVERAETREKPYFLFDDHLPGFCARIAPNGKRHYYLQYMKNKRVKRLALGMHGVLTAENARDQATAILANIKSGSDPLEEKIQKTLEPTVCDLSERYMKEHVTMIGSAGPKQMYTWISKVMQTRTRIGMKSDFLD